MQTYFLKLFNYDFVTNQTVINTVKIAGSPGDTLTLLSHLVAASRVWLGRCMADPNSNTDELWMIKPLESLEEINIQNNKNWIEFLKNEQQFDRPITYTNSKGNRFTDSLSDILAHVINHGTHHRAQIGQQLKFAGAENLPNTDYIFYLREHGS